jgi:hypothetical protein
MSCYANATVQIFTIPKKEDREMAGKISTCVDCGNSLSITAKTCGNSKCCSTDPFGKDRLNKKLSRFLGVVMIVGACSFYIYQYGFVNPLQAITQSFQIKKS